MATYKSDIIQAKDSLDVSGKSLSGEKTGAQVLYATAEYTWGYPEYAYPYDIIQLADIPAGATVVPHLSWVNAGFEVTQLNLHLGDNLNYTKYGMAGTDVPDGPGKLTSGYRGSSFFGYDGRPALKYEKETRVIAMVAHDNFGYPATGSKLTFGIAYRVQG